MTAPNPDQELETFDLTVVPEPFRQDRFARLRTGIHDDPRVSVFVNEPRDFAALFPQPRLDYDRYEPRFQSLGLRGYRKRNLVVERRLDKIRPWLAGGLRILEIGAADGAFLAQARAHNPELRIACLEVDANSRAQRAAVEGLEQHAELTELVTQEQRFDVICFFHVLEHIVQPAAFLAQCRAILAPGGRLIIEVPSLDDPLLTLFRVPEYEAFYFQRQHPYVYSARSLARLLRANGLEVRESIPHQRYGLENHLAWLAHRRPGGDERLRAMFVAEDAAYRKRLEAEALTDATIVVAEVA